MQIMKYLKHYILLIFLFSSFFSFSQSKNEELLDWSATRRLTWNDYKAKPEPGNDDAAATTTYLGIEYNITSDGFGYKIQSPFSKTRSWGRYKDDYVLSHEQGHFDIAEIFARKLNKQMSEYVFNKKTYQQDLNKIYNDILAEKEKMQNEYDEETNHSINKEKQAEWLKKISDLLKEYEAWKGY
jgi:Bacterial protein of unknown function (DUF922)